MTQHGAWPAAAGVSSVRSRSCETLKSRVCKVPSCCVGDRRRFAANPEDPTLPYAQQTPLKRLGDPGFVQQSVIVLDTASPLKGALEADDLQDPAVDGAN